MVKKRSLKKRSVAIDTVPLPERPKALIGMPTKKGKVSVARGKYFLTVGRKKMEIPVGMFVSAKEVRKLAGKEVYAAMSGSSIVAIGVLKVRPPRVPPCYWILCYYPADVILRRIRPEIRRKLISEMVGKRVISTKLARELRRGL